MVGGGPASRGLSTEVSFVIVSEGLEGGGRGGERWGAGGGGG